MARKKVQFEEAMMQLEEIITKLGKGEIPLADAVELYKDGMNLVQICMERLEQVQGELKVYSNGSWQNEQTIGE